MLVKITLYDNTVYKFASKTTDKSDGLYLGRLREELSLSSKMAESGSAPATQNLTIYNGDSYIPRSKNFWGANLLLTQDNGLTWLGKVTFFNFDADGNLYITASEKGAPELELQLPDEVRQVYTVDENFHQSSTTMTIPLAVGGSAANPILLPTILIDKTQGIYLICVGEIRSILKVYNGSTELPSSAYQAYTGTASQALHPGFAYVKLNEAYRKNDDDTYAEINVEIVGLKLGNHTEEECRNGARFLYWFLKTPSSGVGGWGCGIDESEIDTASFTSAISKVDLMGLKLDGVMWLRQSAQSWIDQICQAIHGSYSIGANGKRKLFIDYAGAASKKTFNANKIILNKYGKDSYANTVYNKGMLSYGYNPVTGLFMQSAQFENSTSIAQIGEQKFTGESYLINDAATALAVLEYTCKRSLSSAEAVDFTTDDLTTDLFAGDIITIDRTDLGISGEFQIASISTSDTKSEITAVRFDSSVFTVTGSHSNINWADEKQITSSVIPGEITNLNLSTDCEIMSDGTANVYITGTFTVPNGGWLFAAVQYGEGASPTNWTELSLIENGVFKITSLKPNTIYSVRVRMVTATGHSDYVSGTVRSAGDSTAPEAPSCTANTYLKTVKIAVVLNNPPADLAGFEIWRSNIEGNPGTKIGYVAAIAGSGNYVDTDAANYLTDFYYSAIAVDKWGNRSGYSNQAVANCAKIQVHDVTADWVMANTFETAENVGPDVDGVRFNASGIEGWLNGVAVFDLNKDSASTIGGWTIGATSLSGGNIQINSNGTIRTSDFVSGHSGWSVYGNGKAEFQDVTIRGTMTAVNFVKDTVSAVGGSLMIMSSAEIQSYTKTTQNAQNLICEDYIDLVTEDGANLVMEASGSSIYYTVTVDDASTFNAADILRIRNADTVQDLWLGVASKSSNTLNCVMLYGTALNLESGMCVVDYRKAGNGGILLNGNSPLIDLFTHSGNPWNGTDNWIRIGNLNGIGGITDTRYGIFIGKQTGHWMRYDQKSGVLQINGDLVAAGGTFSGRLVAASGSFSGHIEAESGTIGKFELINGVLTYTKDDLDFDDGSIVIQNPNVVIEGQNAGSFKTMLTLGGMKSKINFSDATNRGSYIVETGLNLDSSSSHYGNVETAYSHISKNQLAKSTSIIAYNYLNFSTYTRNSTSGNWNSISYFDVGINGISQLYKENGFYRQTIANYNEFSIADYNTHDECRITPTNLYVGNINSGSAISLTIDRTSNSVSGYINNCYGFSLNGKGLGNAARNISLSMDSSYASSVPVVNIGVSSSSYLALSTVGQIAIGGVRGNLDVTGTIKSSTLSTGAVNSSNGVLTGSAEELKTNIKSISVLKRLKFLRVMQWKYKTDLNTLHIGPMAKDFNTLFKVNKESGEGINYTDSIGVALRAVQELQEELDDLKRKHRSLKRILLMKKAITENDFLQDRDFFVNLLIEKEKEVVDRIKNKTRRHILERLDYIRMEKEFNK